MQETDRLTTWAKIDLEAIEHNITQVQQHLKPTSNIMAVVKANAYGHGAVEVAKRAVKKGVQYLAVATVEEGIELREAGLDTPILVLGTLLEGRIKEVITYNLTPVVYTLDLAEKLSAVAKDSGTNIKVHLKVDTGMGRIGILATKTPVERIKNIVALDNLEVEGIFTHFAAADEDKEYTKKQLQQFNSLLNKLEKLGIEIPIKHAANSAAIIDYPEAHYDFVRLGIALYGMPPAQSLADKLDLKAVLSWKARIVHVKSVASGTNISYGCTYTTQQETKVATLAVGYYDGYFRQLSNQAEVLVAGQRVPVIGRVCMDQIMVDITGVEAQKGDIATLLGTDGNKEITAAELAKMIGTINYEVVSRIGPRVQRIF